MIVCLLVAILAGITMFFREPIVFILWVGGWLGFMYFRYRMYDKDDSVGHQPVHKPRHRHPPARTPSKYD